MALIRIDIETHGIRRATPAFTAADSSRLEEIIGRMDCAEQSHDSYAKSELDREFHMAIFRIAGLPALEPILTRCTLPMHRFTFAGDPPAPVAAVSVDGKSMAPGPVQHREIAEAIAAGNPGLASETMRRHIETVIGAWSPELKQAMAKTGTA